LAWIVKDSDLDLDLDVDGDGDGDRELHAYVISLEHVVAFSYPSYEKRLRCRAVIRLGTTRRHS
jgi:hypothetical protein